MDNAKIFISLLVCFFLVPNLSCAIPVIDSVNTSSIASRGAVLITGHGFGEKQRPVPLKWDDFEQRGDAFAAGETISNGWGHSIQTSSYNEPKYSSDTPRTGSSKYVRCNFSDGHYGSRFYYNHGGTLSPLYVTFWFRRNHTGPASDNIKFFRVSATPETIGTAPLIWHSIIGGTYSIGIRGGREGDEHQIGNTHWIGDFPEGRWIRFEGYYTESSPFGAGNGIVREWIDWNDGRGFTEIINLTTDTNLEGYDTHWTGTAFGKYVHLTGGSYTNDFDDIYIDTTQARIEIGDRPSWNDCTHREIQIPTSWSDDSITFTVNQGSFENGSRAYIFVVDGNGTPSRGYPINFSQNVPWPVITSSVPPELPAGTGAYTIKIRTDKASMCRYDTRPGVPYGEMKNEFNARGAVEFPLTVYGLEDGKNYTYYIKCTCPSCGWATTPDDFVLNIKIRNSTHPVIDRINGTITSKNTITITGKNFGTVDVGQIFWDDFENGYDGDYLKDHSGWLPNNGNGAIYSSKRSYSGKLSAHNQVWPGSGTSFSTNHISYNKTLKVFASYRFRAEATGTDLYGVLKLSRLTSDYNGELPHLDYYNGPGDTVWGRSSSNCIDGGLAGSFNSGTSVTQLWNGAVRPSVWQRYDMYKKLSTPGLNNGHILFQNNNKVTWQQYVMTRESGFDFNMSYFTLGLMLANSRNDANFSLFIDDVYISNTLARVEICNESDWLDIQSKGAVCDIQLPVSWNETTIRVKINSGKFSDGDAAYLFVVTENGTTNRYGYPIHFGHGAAHPADTNHNGKIELAEILAFIGLWTHSSQIRLTDLVTAIKMWKAA